MKRILLIVLLFSAGWLHAQTDFKPGYVVTGSNETIYGEIDYRGDRLMGQLCRFRLNGRDIVEYTPYDISAYRFNDGKYYVSKEVSGKKVFLEFLIQGIVNIYYGRDEIGDHYYIDKAGEPLTEIPYEEGIREVEGLHNKAHKRQVFYTTKTHIGILNYYMQDAPGILRQIQEMKKPEHDNLIKIVRNYHYAVCTDGSPCIVFERKLPLAKIALDAAGGMVYYREGRSLFTGGILLHVWMPRANEKLYLRTGLLYSQYKETEMRIPRYTYVQSIYRIPFMLEYIYPKPSLIKPKAAYGVTLYNFRRKNDPNFISPYSSAGQSVTFMGGCNIRLTSFMSLSLEYNADFIPMVFFLIPKSLYTHSALGGLHFRF